MIFFYILVKICKFCCAGFLLNVRIHFQPVDRLNLLHVIFSSKNPGSVSRKINTDETDHGRNNRKKFQKLRKQCQSTDSTQGMIFLGGKTPMLNTRYNYKARSTPGRDCLRCFSLTLSHSVPKHWGWTNCRGINLTFYKLGSTSSRSCANSQLGDWTTCIMPDLNQAVARIQGGFQGFQNPPMENTNPPKNFRKILKSS
jgi:hypothetical protein